MVHCNIFLFLSDVPPVVPVYNQEGSTSDGEGSSTEDSNEVHLNGNTMSK